MFKRVNLLISYLPNLCMGTSGTLLQYVHYFSIFHEEWRKWTPYLPRISRKVTSC